MKINFFVIFLLMFTFSHDLLAQTVFKHFGNDKIILNAVLVDTTSVNGVNPNIKPFYIDIFEANCKEKKLQFGTQLSCFKEGRNEEINRQVAVIDESEGVNYPAIFSLYIASLFCKNKGGRVPTIEEWNLAAFNLNKNKNSTHYTDKILNQVNASYGNFGQEKAIWKSISYGSNLPNDYQLFFIKEADDIDHLSIESIGTLGMTGNIGETTISDSSTMTKSQCGLTENEGPQDILSFLSSKNLCNSNNYSYNFGLRCVYDADIETRVFLDTNRIKGKLKKVIDYNQNMRQQNILKGNNNGSILGFYPPVYLNFNTDFKVSNWGVELDLGLLNIDPSLKTKLNEHLETRDLLNVTPASEVPNPDDITFKKISADWETDRLIPTIEFE